MIRILLLSLLALAPLGARALDTADSRAALQLSAEGKYSDVVRQLSSVTWTRSSNPDVFLTYCRARFEVHNQERTCLVDQRSHPNAIAFSNALWNGWSGRTRAAKAAFERLLREKDWSVWGMAGLLELSEYTHNVHELGSLLKRFEPRLTAEPRFVQIYNRYRLAFAEDMLDWADLAARLRKYSPRQIASDPILFSAQFRLFFVRGNKSELAQLLADASGLRDTTAYMLRTIDYLALDQGIQPSKAQVIKAAASHPDNARLVLERAYVELFDGSPNIAAAALDRIHKVAASSPNHIRLLLDVAVDLASFHKPDDSNRVFWIIDASEKNLDEFTAFFTLGAWHAVYRGDLDEASNTIRRALKMAPKDAGANWLRALLAKRGNDPQEGVEAVRNLLRGDPYNENYVSVMLDLREKHKTPAMESLYEEVSRHASRYSERLRRRFN